MKQTQTLSEAPATEEEAEKEMKKNEAQNTRSELLKISTVYDSINNNCYSVHITALFTFFTALLFHFSFLIRIFFICSIHEYEYAWPPIELKKGISRARSQ